jgi:predicted site-specific integrase-resolvase
MLLELPRYDVERRRCDMKKKIWRMNSQARIVNYRRVGTKDQSGNCSLEKQKEPYERYRKYYNWVTVASIVDTGSGASISQRKGMEEVLRLVRSREIDGVFVTDPDRLCRSGDLRDLATIYDAFIENSVRLVTPNRVYDLKKAGDFLSFNVERLLAEYNKRCLIQKTKEDKQKARPHITSYVRVSSENQISIEGKKGKR